ncbi:MAG: hypothetical protein IJX20_03280 [Alphaproteobacteria bacterium]|nr:hypothetical protein [Alphaproteobacteria bacterium]
MKQRVIGLIDCDSFFVSCERVDNPDLQDKPVCVMTGSGNKGVIISRSKEAKLCGIKMGAPYFQVQKTHPRVICIPAHHQRYRAISGKVMSIIKTFSPDVEEFSIDESYLDLTGLNKVYKTTYTDLITKIRQTVLEEVNVPVSIGLSSSKTLAKLASDKAKNTNGIFVIRPDKIVQTIGNISIDDVCGIGNQSAKNLKFNGVFTIKDFVAQDNTWLKKILGMHGLNLKMELSGIAVSPVDSHQQSPQSIQDTKSFEDFTDNLQFLQVQLGYHVHHAAQKLRKWNGFCGEVGVILRTKDFNTIALYAKPENATNSDFLLRDMAYKLLNQAYRPKLLYRSIGIELRKLSYNEEIQQSLFETLKHDDDKLSRILDNLEEKFGKDVVKLGL